MRQKSAVFAERGIDNIFMRPGYAEFYRAVATDPRFNRIVHVSKLEVGAETAAVNLALVFRGRYYYVLSSYTEGQLARLGPGAIHLRELMRYAIDRGIAFFDFTIGDESTSAIGVMGFRHSTIISQQQPHEALWSHCRYKFASKSSAESSRRPHYGSSLAKPGPCSVAAKDEQRQTVVSPLRKLPEAEVLLLANIDH